MDQFEADVMDDLMYDAAEGPSRQASSSYDEYDEGDEFEESDNAYEGDDEFLGRLLGGIGQAAGAVPGGGAQFDEYDEGDELEAMDEYDEFDELDEFDTPASFDAMEEAVADAMDAGDADEFFRRLGSIARGAVNVARRVGRGVGQAARVVGPLASMIPLPQAQLIGRLANVAGRLLADGADEFEAFDDLIDGMDEDAIDAAAPVLAGMVVRRALPSVARAAAPVRRQAVRTVARAVRQSARRQGPQGARAVARAVQATRRIVQRRRLPPRQAARVAGRVAQQVVRRPQAVRRLARPLVPAARRATPAGQAAQVVARTVAPVARRVAAATRPAAGPGYAGFAIGGCARCANRQLRLRGPVTITIRSR